MVYYIAAVTVISAVLSAVALRYLIPVLKSKKMGQRILEIGPRWHASKEGTPTMGGIAMIGVFLALALVCGFLSLREKSAILPFFVSVFYAVLSGLVGVTDDICKLKKSKNEGLTAGQKYLLQLFLASVYLVLMRRMGVIDETVKLPFTDIQLGFGWLFYPFGLLFLTGFNNAVNLTDGIDGLCASVTSAVALTFSVLFLRFGNLLYSGFSAAIFGVCLGFLVYNFYPARVFMGDTGSLFLGAAVSAMAVLSGELLLLCVLGIVYVIETASVILQVGYFKLTGGKRLFKISPFHHHLEKCGWSEKAITLAASAVTLAIGALCCLIM